MKITIFGLAGSGTSTIGKLLAKKTNYTFMSSGNIMRSWAKDNGMTIYDYEEKIVKNDSSFDIKLDNEVREYGIKNNNFIFESRLAWNFIPDSFKIFLECNKKTRYKRIQGREKQSLKEIEQKNVMRESGVILRYNKLYPFVNFPPTPENFDLIIDVSNLLPEEIIKLILEKTKLGKFI